jgi:hypothetical protein
MTPVTRMNLLDETVLPQTLSESLTATRAAARRRRILRRTSRLGAVAALLAASAGILLRQPAQTDAVARPAPTPLTHPGFIAIATRPDPTAVTTAQSSPSVVVVETANSGVTVVSTQLPPVPASEADLFAAAGSRPAALQRHHDGTSSWMWLDQAH